MLIARTMVSTFSTSKSIPKATALRLVSQGPGTGKYDSGTLGRKKGFRVGGAGFRMWGLGLKGGLEKMKIKLERPI